MQLFGHAPDRAGDIDRGCLELAHGGTIVVANVDTIGFALQERLVPSHRQNDRLYRQWLATRRLQTVCA